ncbi:hypothetical protein M569_11202, partial [Genlisea aurea]
IYFAFSSATGVLPSQEVFSHVDNDDNVPPLTKPQISSSLGDGNVEPAISVSERAELKTAEPDRIGSKVSAIDELLLPNVRFENFLWRCCC